jgi:hypothetical protein
MRVALLLAFPLAVSAQDYRPTPVDLPQSTYDGKLRVSNGLAVTEFASPGSGPAVAGWLGREPSRHEIARLVDANQTASQNYRKWR